MSRPAVKAVKVNANYPGCDWHELGPLYWTVRVFPTKKAMYAYYRRHASPWDRAYAAEAGWPAVCNFEGITCGRETLLVRRGKPDRLRPRLGEVLLWRGRLGCRVLSHEALHMATLTLRAVGRQKRQNLLRLRQDGIDDREETIAYTLCHLFAEMVGALRDARLLR